MSLKTFRDAYARADDFCREVQAFVDQAGIPAMNELRYAGYHLLHAIDDAGAVVKPEELVRATNHALRAGYEAGEAGILTALDQIAQFQHQYAAVPITGVVPNYVDILRDAQAASDRHTADREHDDDRIDDLDAFRATFAKLKGHCRTLELAREEMNKLVQRSNRDTRRFVVTALIAVLAIVVGGALTVAFSG